MSFYSANKEPHYEVSDRVYTPQGLRINDYPRITIVTPSFNQGEYLEETIDSILSQGYPNLEYMILDGASTDGSLEIIKKYEKYLSYWRSCPDDGHYAAVNEGLKRSTGEILGWLNSDDKFHPSGLFVLAEVFHSFSHVQLVTGKRQGFTESGGYLNFDNHFAQRWSRSLLLDPQNFGKNFLTIMQEGTYWRRDLWEKAGGFINTRYKLAADYELWARFSRYAQIHTVDTGIAGFRSTGANQRSSKFKAEYVAEALKIIEQEKFFKTVSETDSDTIPTLIPYPFSLSTRKGKKVFSSSSKHPLPRKADPSWPRISIVTPSYNQGAFIEECIDSILSQGYPNLDFQIYDAGSTDNSVTIIKKYEKYLTHWQSKSDNGQYAAIQDGLTNRADGEILTWLNSDDILHPGSLHIAGLVFKSRQDIEWITGLPNCVSALGTLSWTFSRVPKYSRESVCFTNYSDPFIQQEGTFWRRSLWEKVGGLDLRWKLAADLDL